MSAAFVVRAIAGIGSIALLGWLALRLFPAEERSPAPRQPRRFCARQLCAHQRSALSRSSSP